MAWTHNAMHMAWQAEMMQAMQLYSCHTVERDDICESVGHVNIAVELLCMSNVALDVLDGLVSKSECFRLQLEYVKESLLLVKTTPCYVFGDDLEVRSGMLCHRSMSCCANRVSKKCCRYLRRY